MNKAPFAAVILAAGYSSRMGKFKPLLSLGDKTVLESTVSTFRLPFISDILVVVGHNREKIVSHVAHQLITLVENPNYEEGMFSSIQAGVSQLPSSTDAFFIMPVDIPFVLSDTIKKLVDAYNKNSDHIIRPQYQGRFGHPPLIPSRLIPTILNSNGDGGLRKVLRHHREMTVPLPVIDPAIHRDLDFPEDYRKAMKDF